MNTFPTTEEYTPGFSANAVDFMARRTVESHAQFLRPYLQAGLRLLDIGCGPGTISIGLAKAVAPGEVMAIDFGPGQVEAARHHAAASGIHNIRFQVGSIYSLPFPEAEFDIVFAHAVFEHLKEPLSALQEIRRVLKPGGLVALRSPDWGGFIIAPESPSVSAAIQRYTEIQTCNGGDVHVGRKFPALLRTAGFTPANFSATYECYQPVTSIGEYLALRLETEGDRSEAEALRQWSRHLDAVFAQAWCEIVGYRSPG
ncbi:MAG TPA: methyltransferase domain-containing protein [Pseudomonadales bacterium]|nr:methyltransferase domain-containing protein [Pseudomonadales bacterium]